MNPNLKDNLQFIAFLLLLFALVLGATLGIGAAASHARNSQINQGKFIGKCELLKGHVATFDEGETQVCISGGKVVLKG